MPHKISSGCCSFIVIVAVLIVTNLIGILKRTLLRMKKEEWVMSWMRINK